MRRPYGAARGGEVLASTEARARDIARCLNIHQRINETKLR
ncbi:MAG: hypothetical protein U0271_28780 [Polyangiaceae bacterium]